MRFHASSLQDFDDIFAPPIIIARCESTRFALHQSLLLYYYIIFILLLIIYTIQLLIHYYLKNYKCRYYERKKSEIATKRDYVFRESYLARLRWYFCNNNSIIIRSLWEHRASVVTIWKITRAIAARNIEIMKSLYLALTQTFLFKILRVRVDKIDDINFSLVERRCAFNFNAHTALAT